MFNKAELLDAIEELEMSPATYQNAEKLATFYLLYEHLYTRQEPQQRVETVQEIMIDEHGTSEFLQAAEGKPADEIWPILDELMTAVQALQPRLYNAMIQKLKDL
jgi:hypothetical protein